MGLSIWSLSSLRALHSSDSNKRGIIEFIHHSGMFTHSSKRLFSFGPELLRRMTFSNLYPQVLNKLVQRVDIVVTEKVATDPRYIGASIILLECEAVLLLSWDNMSRRISSLDLAAVKLPATTNRGDLTPC